MRVRRLISVLCACLAASVSVAAAQPKADPKKDAPAPGTGPGTGTGTGGQEVQMSEDAPPSDMEGRDENPDAPKIIGSEPVVTVEKKAAPKRTGYPIEEARRPITLPRNMAEVGLAPHLRISRVSTERNDSEKLAASDALRARYGITDKVQLGLSYVFGGIYDDPSNDSTKVGFHPGKAVGLDVTVLLKDWLAVKLGVPLYIDPFAVGITLGAPMKWQFADGKYALGALDDFIAFRANRFLPSFYQEAANADAANGTREGGTNTIQSDGELRFSAWGVMQYKPKTAFIGRLGVVMEDFSTTRTDAGDNSGLKSFIRAGVQHTIRKYLDLGFSIGFDDLSKAGSFGPAGSIAFRI